MKPVRFKEANFNNEHGDLPCHAHDAGMICCWQMSIGERIKALFTGRVWVSVIGQFVPPMLLGVKCPFVKYRIAIRDEAKNSIAGIGQPEENADAE